VAESNLMVTSRQKDHEQLQGELDEGQLLAAALVAALVEYRQHVRQPNEHEKQPGTRTNWRMMSRWQQLRG
jgi:hypothetical protein